MSFASVDKANMEIAFPSKLADYTAAGLPLLIVGSPYCSGVRWANDNPGLTEVVDSDGHAPLDAAIEQLVNDPEHRTKLAASALLIGEQVFSHTAAQSQLYDALRRPWVA